MNEFTNTKILNVLQPNNAKFQINEFNYVEDDCLELWIDLSDAVQRSLGAQKMLKTSFGDLVFIEEEQDILKISEGNDVFLSLLLLLKALYVEVKGYNSEYFIEELEDIEKCLYLDGELRFVTDEANGSLINILRTGEVSDDDNSSYASCYRYYQGLIKQHAKVREELNGIMIQMILYKFSFNVKVM